MITNMATSNACRKWLNKEGTREQPLVFDLFVPFVPEHPTKRGRYFVSLPPSRTGFAVESVFSLKGTLLLSLVAGRVESSCTDLTEHATPTATAPPALDMAS